MYFLQWNGNERARFPLGAPVHGNPVWTNDATRQLVVGAYVELIN